MTEELVVAWGQGALVTAMYVGGPLLLTALVVGTAVSLLQSVTQVQEMTLVFVPKTVAVFAVLAVLGGWMLRQMVAFGTIMFQSIGA